MGRKVEGNGRPPIDAVDGRGSPIATDPKAYLRSIIFRYQDASRTKQLNSFSEAEHTRGYFEGFRRSRFFRQHVYDAAADEAERTIEPPKLLTVKDYGHTYAGFLFEQMAYADKVVQLMGSNKAVLSPEEVHNLYKILYPNNNVIKGHFGQDYVEGVYQPDGLVINTRTLEVEEVLEYKLYNGQEDFESQYNGFLKQKFRSHQVQRRLFRHSRFTMITPKDFEERGYHERRFAGFQKLRVTKGEFGEFVQDTYYQPVVDEELALIDMLRARAATPSETQPVTLVPGEVADLRQPSTTWNLAT